MTRYAFLAIIIVFEIAQADPHLQQITLQSPEHVAVGTKPKRVQIDVLVPKGFHLQANPASHDGLIPTEIQLEPSGAFDFSSFSYPKGSPLKLNTTALGEVLTYSGNFPISFEIDRKPASDVKKEKTLVKGQIHFQACDDHVCLRPASIPFEFWVESPR